MSETTYKRNNETIGIDVVLSVLESGHSIELQATGYSMFPALRPGDRVLVNPLTKGELPVVGSVIVCMAEGGGRKAEVDEWNEEIPHSGSAGRRDQSGNGKPQTVCRIPHAVLVMHRLVEIKKDVSGKCLLITRGDSMSENDLPWYQDKITGLADSYTRNGGKYIIKIRIPYALEYNLNRLLLWIWYKSGKRQK